MKDWKLLKHNHGHHDKADSLIMDIIVMEKKDKVAVHDHIKTRWIDLYAQDDTRDDSDHHILCSSLCICMIDWCKKEYNF